MPAYVGYSVIARPWMFGVIVLLMLAYEVVALVQGQGHTISEIIWRLTKSHPLTAFGFGLLMGHFFWQAEKIWKNGSC